MKVTRTGLLIASIVLVSGILVFFAVGCTPDEPASTQTGTETTPVTAARAPRFTANQFCAACHADFADEPFALRHEKAGIGCERCHGESEKHRSDEDNITPPELMYPKERINPTCMMCHPRQDIQSVSSHKSLLEGADTIFDGESEEETSTGPQYCTDCHAKKHKMNVRTIHWNKATGELMPR